MRKIKLTQGKYALVDDEDFGWLSKFTWCFITGHRTDYAATNIKVEGKRVFIYMHRLILGAKKGQVTDHINGNKLDNRRCNLRFVTISQNAMNSKRRDLKFKGVAKNKIGGWGARICKDYNKYYIGTFKTAIQAAKAYDLKAKELFGEFAKLNFG